MGSNNLKVPYPIFDLKVKDSLKKEASGGNYNKWKIKYDNRWIWIKAGSDFMGSYAHEGVMEVVASNLAKELGINDVTEYFPCVLHIKELNGEFTNSIGCYSYDFTEENEEVVSFDDLKVSSGFYNADIRNIAEITDISEDEIRDYVDRCLLIDSLVLNTDRHYGNLAVIKNKVTGKYRLCPVFDFGLALGGLSYTSVEEKAFSDYELSNYRAKPYSNSHDAQLDLTRYKDNIDGRIETIHMDEGANWGKVVKVIDRMFGCFGIGYLDNWTQGAMNLADTCRSMYCLQTPLTKGDRYYIISTIKRRMEVILLGKAMPYSMCQDKIDKEIEMLECMRYK